VPAWLRVRASRSMIRARPRLPRGRVIGSQPFSNRTMTDTAASSASLLELATTGRYAELEDAWVAAVEGGTRDFAMFRKVVNHLVSHHKNDLASALVGVLLQSCEPDTQSGVLDFAVQMALAFPKDPTIRQCTAVLHDKAGEPGVDRFLKPLALCQPQQLDELRTKIRGLLALRKGGFANGTKRVGPEKLAAYKPSEGVFVLTDGETERSLTVDEAREELQPLPEDDFRGLLRFDVARLKSLAQEDPAALVRSALRSNKNRLEFPILKKLLARGVVDGPSFTRWWNKAKGLVERDPLVQVYGDKQPTLILRTNPITHEEELAQKLARASRIDEKLSYVVEYLEALDEGHTADETFLHQCGELLVDLAHDSAVSNPEAVAAASIAMEVASRRTSPMPKELDKEAVKARFRQLADLPAILGSEELARRALLFVKHHDAEDWPRAYADALPTAPGRLADQIARELLSTGNGALLQNALTTILTSADRCGEGILWLWKAVTTGFFDDTQVKADGVAITMTLLRLMDRWARSAKTVLNDAQRNLLSRMRSAVAANNFRNIDKVLEVVTDDQALALHHEIKGNEGVSELTRGHITTELVASHRDAILGRKELWEEDQIYVTQRGMQRRRQEFEQIVNVEMVKNSEAIGHAAAGFGDLSENAEFTAALEQRDFLSRRANEISAELNKAKVIPREEIDLVRVNVGTPRDREAECRRRRRDVVHVSRPVGRRSRAPDLFVPRAVRAFVPRPHGR
jgi:hypothetical protein